MRASLFITTYEMPRHLQLVLEGVARQTTKDFELWICDDGSAPLSREIVESFQKRVSFPVRYIWQEHQGFRKCRILNQALRQAQGDTCIFLDGDCIPHPRYVEDHLREQEPGRFLAGRRVELGPRFSAYLTSERVARGCLDRVSLRFLWSVLTRDSDYLNRMVRIPWQRVRHRFKLDQVVDLKGCNYSVSRKDLEAINGFDEEYEGYGREDTDVELRLQNLGLRIKSLKGLALQYHLWHPRRDFTPTNDGRLEELKRSGRTVCRQGLKEMHLP